MEFGCSLELYRGINGMDVVHTGYSVYLNLLIVSLHKKLHKLHKKCVTKSCFLLLKFTITINLKS